MLKIKVGQIGIGTWGKNHCQLLAEMPEVALVGLHDIHVNRCGRSAQDYGTREFENLPALLEQIEALVVTASTPQHFEITHLALSKGVHVFVEKPICTTVAEARTLVELAERQGLVLQVGHIERFNPAFRVLRGEPLEPLYVECRRLAPFSARSSDISVVLDLMIHDLDLLQTVVASPHANIVATGLTVCSPGTDFANARIEFENGCVANVTASRVAESKVRQMDIFQRDSGFRLDFLSRRATKFSLNGRSQPRHLVALSAAQHAHAGEQNLLQVELEAFLGCVRNSARPEVDGLNGLEALALAQEIMRQIEQTESRTDKKILKL
ncbi:MAG: Gfo/Idh/MocA family protein [bacterium]